MNHAPLKIKNDLVFLGIPLERFIIPEFMMNRDEIQNFLSAAGLAVQTYQAQGHRVDKNRDMIVSAFLAHPRKPDWLLMLDSDMKHPVDCALRLIAHRHPVVGALYFHRGTHDPLVFKKSSVMKDEYGRDTQMWEYMTDPVYEYLDRAGLPNKDDSYTIGSNGNPLLDCDAVGTGCMLIHRSVLEKMEAPWFEYPSGALSEDISFCRRVKEELGLPVYTDLSTVCGHYKLAPMGQAQFRAAYRGRGYTGAGYSPDMAIQWLEDFAGVANADTAMRTYSNALLAKLWEKHTESGEPTEMFYEKKETGEAYLLDLLWWNASPSFANLRSQLMGVERQKALIIGSGIGTTAIQLAMQRCDVVAVEPNPVLRKFAIRRWKWTQENKAKGAVGSIDFRQRFARGKPRSGQFDLAVAIDVFEHMDFDVLERTMEMLAANVRIHGRVFVHNNWGDQHIYPMHFDHGAEWGDLVDRYKFREIGELWLERIAQ